MACPRPSRRLSATPRSRRRCAVAQNPSVPVAAKNTGRHAPKRVRGRPPVLTMPEPVPDTPENIGRACIQGSPKKDWNHLRPATGAGVIRERPERRRRVNRPLIHTCHLCLQPFLIRNIRTGTYNSAGDPVPALWQALAGTSVHASGRKKLTARSWIVTGPEGSGVGLDRPEPTRLRVIH